MSEVEEEVVTEQPQFYYPPHHKWWLPAPNPIIARCSSGRCTNTTRAFGSTPVPFCSDHQKRD